MTEKEHDDPSKRWLYFFFVCFVFILVGIVVFFAREYNSQTAPAPATGEHGSMILPADGQHAPHVQILSVG